MYHHIPVMHRWLGFPMLGNAMASTISIRPGVGAAFTIYASIISVTNCLKTERYEEVYRMTQ
jgi:hypothetical protein